MYSIMPETCTADHWDVTSFDRREGPQLCVCEHAPCLEMEERQGLFFLLGRAYPPLERDTVYFLAAPFVRR